MILQPKERSILFSGEMVKALMEGKKTQTRRVINLPKERGAWEATTVGGDGSRFSNGTLAPEMPVLWNTTTGTCLGCPLGGVGRRLWVRETFACERRDAIVYKADLSAKDQSLWKWRSSIYMPRWASRITLEITEVRVQRVQEISEKDCKAEGIPISLEGTVVQEFGMGQRLYRNLWNSLNGKKAPWDSNPWVWVLNFRVL